MARLSGNKTAFLPRPRRKCKECRGSGKKIVARSPLSFYPSNEFTCLPCAGTGFQDGKK